MGRNSTPELPEKSLGSSNPTECRSLKEILENIARGETTDFSNIYRDFTNPYHNYNTLHTKRFKFYSALKRQLPSDHLVHYPGSGSDPIPVEIFGKQVVYSSLREGNYFKYLMDPTNRLAPAAYRDRIKQSGPFKNLLAVWANFLNSPFRDASFDALIFHDIPSEIYVEPKFLDETNRLLKPKGILVIEGESEVTGKGEYSAFLNDTFSKIIQGGFEKHPLDLILGVSDLSFLLPRQSPDDPSLPPDALGNFIDQPEFTRRLMNGEHIVLQGHEIRVFTKN